jgi:hypothetical protein
MQMTIDEALVAWLLLFGFEEQPYKVTYNDPYTKEMLTVLRYGRGKTEQDKVFISYRTRGITTWYYLNHLAKARLKELGQEC